MGNKFNPEDLKNPLYEHSQVVTVYELQIIYGNLARQYNTTHWWNFRTRLNLVIGGHIILELINWLNDGKPTLQN